MNMPEVEDGVLVRRVRQGDLEAYGDLVRRYQGSVFGVCYRLLGEWQEAEDLAQDAFLRGYQRLDTFGCGRDFLGLGAFQHHIVDLVNLSWRTRQAQQVVVYM